MAKNMTRKGLALGAAFALTATGLVATPAQAAGEVLFAPSAGTSYNVLLASDFVLTTGIASAYPASNITTLGYKVTNNTNDSVTAVADSPGTDETLTVAAAATATTSTFVAAAGLNTLTVSTAGTATGTVEVTAFLDANANDTFDSGEWATTRTITFVKPSEVTATVDLTKPALGDKNFTAKVTLSGDINLAQVDSDEVTVSWFKAGAAIGNSRPDQNDGTPTAGFSRTSPTAATWSADDAALVAKYEPDTDNTNDTAYTPYSVTAGTFSASATVAGAASGTADIEVVSAATLRSYKVVVTDTTDTEPGTTATDANVTDGTPGTAGTAIVRAGANATVVAEFLDADGAAVANQAVKVTVTPANITTADSVTVAGKAVSTTAVTVDATTDSAGKVSLSIVGGSSDDSDALTFAYALQGYTTVNKVVTFKDAALYLYNTTNPTDERIVIAAGSTFSQSFTVVDQFGALLSGDYRLEATRSGASGRTTAAAWVVSQPLVNGSATLTFVDNGAGADDGTGDTVVLALKKAAVGGGYTSASLTGTDDDEFDLNYVAALPVATALTLAATVTSPALETIAIAGADARVVDSAETGYTDVSHVYGVATKADGSIAAGINVTLSAANVLFQGVAATSNGTGSEANKVFSVGSVTVRTDASGQFEALIYSNKSGKATITATAGSASKTVDVTFAAAKEATGTVLTIDAPANVLPGSTWTATAKLVDKFGNVVDTDQGDAATDPSFSFSAVSPGIQVGSNPADTDADGLAKLAYFIGSNDTGTIVLTATYDADGNTATTTDKYTVSKNIVIGAAVKAQSTSVKRTGNTVAVRVTGYAKSRIVLNGARVASRTSEGTLTRTLNLRAGRNVIQIVVDGKVIRTVRYTR